MFLSLPPLWGGCQSTSSFLLESRRMVSPHKEFPCRNLKAVYFLSAQGGAVNGQCMPSLQTLLDAQTVGAVSESSHSSQLPLNLTTVHRHLHFDFALFIINTLRKSCYFNHALLESNAGGGLRLNTHGRQRSLLLAPEFTSNGCVDTGELKFEKQRHFCDTRPDTMGQDV